MNKLDKILFRARGMVDALYWLPTSGNAAGDVLRNVDGWQYAYRKQGLQFAQQHSDGPLLRDAVKLDLITAAGKTKASSHRFTINGLIATDPDGILADDVMDELSGLAEIEPDTNGRIQGWRLIDGAREAIFGGDPDSEIADSYFRAFAERQKHFDPLLAMGWIRQITSSDGALWALEVTDAGREALKQPYTPQQPHEATTARDGVFDAWREGFDHGSDFFTSAAAPSWTRNFISRQLSSGHAWA